AIAHLHAVAHEIARLIVAYARPGLGADPFEVVDREVLGFGLHQPVTLALASAHVARKWWIDRCRPRRAGRPSLRRGVPRQPAGMRMPRLPGAEAPAAGGGTRSCDRTSRRPSPAGGSAR